jgi:hypothetical protein
MGSLFGTYAVWGGRSGTFSFLIQVAIPLLWLKKVWHFSTDMRSHQASPWIDLKSLRGVVARKDQLPQE